MKIVSLAPHLTEYLYALGAEGGLVGVSHQCDLPRAGAGIPKLTVKDPVPGVTTTVIQREGPLHINLRELLDLQPDLILVSAPGDEGVSGVRQIQSALNADAPERQVRIFNGSPVTLLDVYRMFEECAEIVGCGSRGRDFASKMKAQFMDWAANFHERTRGRKVTFLSALEPYRLGGLWIPDMISLTSALSQGKHNEERPQQVTWDVIKAYNPDVIIVAPEGVPLEDSMRFLLRLEKLPNSDQVPAVKRGQVFFCDGATHFYRPGPRLIDSMGILISAIGGMDSGYISPRDSFYRMRWVEMQRHRLAGGGLKK